MQRSEIVAAIDEELSTLRRVRELLNNSSGSSTGLQELAAKVAVAPKQRRKRRVMSEEARARIGLAQKRRWARQHKAESSAGEAK